MNGKYSENLKSGGELVVTSNSWHIQYYFRGPDLRYNGTFVTVPGKEIDAYISAWRTNFNKYIELKKVVLKGGTFETLGEMGMSIRIGWSEGVCLKSYHMPINKQEDLDKVITDYNYAKNSALKIMSMLKSI